MEPMPIPYPTDPVEIILNDGKARGLRYRASALRRVQKIQTAAANDPDLTSIDVMAQVLYEGLLDKDDIKAPPKSDDNEHPQPWQGLWELIDSRAMKYLTEKSKEALGQDGPKSNPTLPASEN